jgi:hypothetical protein
MKTVKKTSISIIANLLFATAISSTTLAADESEILTDDLIEQYSEKASAVVFAPSLSQGSLFQLRGAFGSATFTRKALDGTWCDAAPVRLLFGDLEGDSVDVASTGAAVLIVMNPVVADKLARGQDIAGDEVTRLDIDMAPSSGLKDIDVLVAGSAPATSGLVLNPGRNFLNDIFGASSTDNSCGHKNARTAIVDFETKS